MEPFLPWRVRGYRRYVSLAVLLTVLSASVLATVAAALWGVGLEPLDWARFSTSYYPPVKPGSISGVVRDTQGNPIEGAWVSASPYDGPGSASAVTGPDGSYTITGLAPGSYWVWAGARGYVLEYYDGVRERADATITCRSASPTLESSPTGTATLTGTPGPPVTPTPTATTTSAPGGPSVPSLRPTTTPTQVSAPTPMVTPMSEVAPATVVPLPATVTPTSGAAVVVLPASGTGPNGSSHRTSLWLLFGLGGAAVVAGWWCLQRAMKRRLHP